MRVAILGQSGRTGGAVARLCDDTDGIERLDWRGRDALPPEAEVVIDFSTPQALTTNLARFRQSGLPLVTGTTGLTLEQQSQLADAATSIAIVQSGNFSTGVAVLAALTRRAAELLNEDFDIEITETHHRRKVDAPSGTALLLGRAAATGRRQDLEADGVYARYGRDAKRRTGEIGFATRRGGGVPGDHEVAFLGDEEVVALSHRALSRDVFARGALRAADWARGQPPGLYALSDVLGL